jgi:CheY-like chemotaxis protein
MHARQEATAGRSWAIVTVADNGAGMDEATLGRAAEPFFTTKGLDGSGLGLSMVQGFASQSGGSLRIASARDVGTTVELRLPVAPPDSRDRPTQAAEPPHAKGRILLVDDAGDVLVTLAAFLTKAGFEVAPAQSGSQAKFLLATEGPFDALVTDFAMPDMNGADLIADGRLLQPGLRPLIITGCADLAFAETLADDTQVLRKPVQRKHLIDALHRVMDPGLDEMSEGATG